MGSNPTLSATRETARHSKAAHTDTAEHAAMERKLKHLEFIQTAVNRMARNSFVIKGWTLLLVAAFLAFIARIGDANLMFIAVVPVILFWALDGYYLHQERLFRALYNSVRDLDESEIDFSMDTSALGGGGLLGAVFSRTLLMYYIAILAILILGMIFAG